VVRNVSIPPVQLARGLHLDQCRQNDVGPPPPPDKGLHLGNQLVGDPAATAEMDHRQGAKSSLHGVRGLGIRVRVCGVSSWKRTLD
jgi:hypothetical protein